MSQTVSRSFVARWFVSPSERLGRDIPADLETIILRCLAKEPARRIADASSLRSALLACADAGAWGLADAKRWWSEQAEAMQAQADAEEHAVSGTAPALAVTLAQRPSA